MHRAPTECGTDRLYWKTRLARRRPLLVARTVSAPATPRVAEMAVARTAVLSVSTSDARTCQMAA